MESFKIEVVLDGIKTEILVIPDENYESPLFHLVNSGKEFVKIEYSDSRSWEVTEGQQISQKDLCSISEKIEAYYY